MATLFCINIDMQHDIRSRNIDRKDEFLLSKIETDCMESLLAYREHRRVFKGFNTLSKDFYITDPQRKARISTNTSNYYTMIMDHLPEWNSYPKRSRSLICSTSIQRAQGYGIVYLVLPVDGAKFGVCPGTDIWETYVIDGYDFYDLNWVWKSYRLSEYNFENFLHKLEKLWKLFTFKQTVFYNDLKKYGLIGALGTPVEILPYLYNPKRLDFRLVNVSDLPYSKFSYNGSHEVWTDSKSYLVREGSSLYNTIMQKYFSLKESASCGATSAGGIATVIGNRKVPDGQFFGGDPSSSIYSTIKKHRQKRKLSEKKAKLIGAHKDFYEPNTLRGTDKVEPIGKVLGGNPKKGTLGKKFFGCSVLNDIGTKTLLDEYQKFLQEQEMVSDKITAEDLRESFLLEYNKERLLHDFTRKLEKRIQNDPTIDNKETTPEQLITEISNFDPTPNKELVLWCVMKYVHYNGETNTYCIKKFEDIASRAIPALQKFKALARKPNLSPPLLTKDVNQIQSLPVLEKIVSGYSQKESRSSSEANDAEEERFLKSGDVDLLYNDSKIKIVVLHDEAASCFFGKGTQWCTAAREHNMFSKYDKNGPLYIVIVKGTSHKYQFHFSSMEYMDEKDEEIDPRKLADKYPILWKIFEPISKKNGTLAMVKNPTEEEQRLAAYRNVNELFYIENPSPKLQMEIARHYKKQHNNHELANVITLIKHPCDELIQMILPMTNDLAWWHLAKKENLSDEIKMKMIQENPSVIGEFLHLSLELQQAAAKIRPSVVVTWPEKFSDEVKISAKKSLMLDF
ncbi:Uncharacterised protein [uncultured archaeon]|nr:Uncharacterised protein [uncultured archaeon]